jgi:hemolysin activation/secretion protein
LALAALAASPAAALAQVTNPGGLLDQQLQQRQLEQQRQQQLQQQKQDLEELKKQEFDRQLVPDPCASSTEPSGLQGGQQQQAQQRNANGWPQSAWKSKTGANGEEEAPTRLQAATDPIKIRAVSLRGTNDYGVLENGKPLLEADLPKLFLQLRQRFEALAKEKPLTVAALGEAQRQAHADLNREGYVLSQVLLYVDGEARDLSQLKAKDQVTVIIVPSFIEKLRLCEGGNGLQAYVRKMLQPVVAGPRPKKVFNIMDLERQLWLIRNFGGVEFTPVLRRGQIFGGTELVGKVYPVRPKFGILADNNVPLQLGSWRLGASVEGIVPSIQPVRFSFVGNNAFPVPGGFIDGFLSLTTPLGNQGWSGEFLWGTTSTSFDQPLVGQSGGSSNYFSLGATYPLLMRRERTLAFSIKGTLQNSTNDLYATTPPTNINTDRIRALRMSLDGTFNAPPVQAADGRYSLGRTTQFGVLLSQGFGGLGSELPAGALPSNPNGNLSFTTARFNVAHYQDLSRYINLDKAKGRLTTISLATFRASGQLSTSALPVPEQFTYGGPFYGRSFYSAYIQGDQGWAASLELSQRFLYNAMGVGAPTGRTYVMEPFAWLDYGATSNLISVQAGGRPSQSVSTYGIGLRSSVLGSANSMELGWGIPATNTVDPARSGIGSSIVYFRLKLGF